ncbi:MAG: hypothetical protein ACYCWW_00815 [Deltaproteobacteria bacterium]
MLAVLCGWPLFKFMKSPDRLPMLPVLGGVFFLSYALPVFDRSDLTIELRSLSDSSIRAALLAALLGWGAILVGTSVPLPGYVSRWRSTWIEPSWKRTGLVGGFLVVLSSLSYPLIQAGGSAFGQIFSLLHAGGPAGFFLLMRLDRRTRLPIALRAFVWAGLFPAALLLAVADGVLAPMLLLLLGALLGRWSRIGRPPWLGLVATLVLFAFFQHAKSSYRALTWGGRDQSLSPIAKAQLFVELAAASDFGDRDSAIDEARQRTDHLSTLAYVIDHTPFPVPYWRGGSYVTALWIFVPRMLYPDKPVAVLGQEFGHRYDLLDYSDRMTSYNFEQLVESFANFGWPGVGAIMLLIGLLYGFIDKFFNPSHAGVAGEFLTVICLLGFVNMESDTAGMLGGVIQGLVLYWPAALMLQGRASARSALAQTSPAWNQMQR